MTKKRIVSKLDHSPRKLDIVFVSPEVAPFSKFGGLADVSWALPRSLAKLGHKVRIVMPKYASIDEKKFNIKMYKEGLVVKTKKKDIVCNVKIGIIPDNIEVYLIENMEYYELRANVYGYKDDARRFILLCLGAIELLRSEDWHVDVVHSNDWGTGFLSNYLKVEYKDDPKVNRIASVFTIHNIALQGINTRALTPTQIDHGTGELPDLLDDKIYFSNGMLRGIIYADFVNTVSERYAKEILNPEYGEGMEGMLKEMRHKLVGIRNGVDYSVLSPDIDKNIYVNYDLNTLGKKQENKLALQQELDLDLDPTIPLVGFVGRLTEQKGLSLLHNTIRPLLKNIDFQLAIVGGGDEYWEKFFAKLITEFPGKVGGHLMISTTFAQKVYAGSDIFIYPSKTEPCGIAHAIAMRFGSVPIVRETGGLVDSVVDYNKDPKHGDGFRFKDYDEMALLIQMVNAITMYRFNKKEWQKLQYRAMVKDLSWESSAKKYEDLYVKAIDRHDKWLKKEGLVMAETPFEVPGYASIDILS